MKKKVVSPFFSHSFKNHIYKDGISMNTKRKLWIKSLDELTRFERAIIKAHPERLVDAVVQGKRDIGKSMFCFKTMTRVFQYLDGIHVDDAYIKALDHMIFTLPDTIEAIDKVIDNTDFDDIMQYDQEHQYRILTLDDAGTHMGKYKFYVDVVGVDQIQSRFDVIREVTSGLLITTPALSGLLSNFREYPGTKRIEISYDSVGDTRYGRIVTIRNKRKKWARYGKLAFPPIKTSIWIDDWAYREYKIKKRKAIQRVNRDSSIKPLQQFNKMFSIVKKMNPNLTKEEVIEKLCLPEELKDDVREW